MTSGDDSILPETSEAREADGGPVAGRPGTRGKLRARMSGLGAKRLQKARVLRRPGSGSPDVERGGRREASVLRAERAGLGFRMQLKLA